MALAWLEDNKEKLGSEPFISDSDSATWISIYVGVQIS